MIKKIIGVTVGTPMNPEKIASPSDEQVKDAVDKYFEENPPEGGFGADGEDGKDGFSPIAKVVQTETGATILIEDAKGNTTAEIRHGTNGKDGNDGQDGVGIQAIEQTTTSTEDGGNNVVTATLTNGQKSTFTVKNGSKGSKGDKGDPGKNGSDANVTSENIKNALNYTPADQKDVERLSEEILDYHRMESASVNKYEIATEHGLITYADGKFNPSENFRSTRFLSIKPNQQYVIGVASSASAALTSMTVSSIAFYDSNKDYISGLSNVNNFETPENAMYYRCSIYYSGTEANIVQINRCQIEEGNVLTSFRDYKEETGYIFEPYAENIFDISEVDTPIKNGYVGDNGSFYANASYESILVEVEEKDIFFINSYSNGASSFPIAYVFDENMKRIVFGENITVSKENINTRFVVPSGARYMAVNSYKRNNISYLIVKKSSFVLEKKIKQPLRNKNFIALGDSIVAQNPSWRDTFVEKTGAKQVLCTAVAGAHLCDYSDTVLNGSDFTNHGNTVCNQVQAILNNPPTENIDFFMICAGTNDTGFTADQLKAKDVSQFYSANQPIDIDTLNRTVIDGAMRWIAEKLWSIQPNAIIFFATPIQAYQGIRTTWYLKLFSEYMETVCAYLGTPIIPAFSESGIYSAFENNNANGKYLIDGLHPNSDGKVKLGNYYANAVGKYFLY